MNDPTIPKDDFLDVKDMTLKLEESILEIIEENQANLAISALMGATINVLLQQCETLEQVLFFRSIFLQAYDNTVRLIKMN